MSNMHMRVKDMSRRQQKAVFANLPGSPSSYSSGTKATRERLARKGLAESKQEKINRIMANKHLTHRQKMDRVARLNKPYRPRTGGSALIIKAPSGLDRGAFNKILLEKKQASTNLYEVNGLLLTQEEYRKGLQKVPKGSNVVDAPIGINRDSFNAIIAKKAPVQGTYIRAGGLSLPMKDYRKGVLRNARLRGKAIKKPAEKDLRGVTKVTRLPLPEQVKDPKKLPGFKGPTKVTRIPLPLADKSYKQLKKQGVKLKATADTDKDGVPNAKDCKPLNPKEQGVLHSLAGKAKVATKKYYKEHHTPEGKRKAAKREYEKYKEKNITVAAERKAEREKAKFEAHQKRKEKQRALKWKKRGKAIKKLAKEAFG